MRRAATALVLAVMWFGLEGCTSPGPTTFRVPAGGYEAAFDAAKDRVREAGFELDRVDARAGVIETVPKVSAGFATPWIADESTLGDEWEGVLNHQQRRVVVRFLPAEEDDAARIGAGVSRYEGDVRAHEGPLRGQVSVFVERIHRPGLRIAPRAIESTSIAIDPELERRGMLPEFEVVRREDDLLAARLARGLAGSGAVEVAGTAADEAGAPGSEP